MMSFGALYLRAYARSRRELVRRVTGAGLMARITESGGKLAIATCLAFRRSQRLKQHLAEPFEYERRQINQEHGQYSSVRKSSAISLWRDIARF
jgi:hypothetical protein